MEVDLSIPSHRKALINSLALNVIRMERFQSLPEDEFHAAHKQVHEVMTQTLDSMLLSSTWRIWTPEREAKDSK